MLWMYLLPSFLSYIMELYYDFRKKEPSIFLYKGMPVTLKLLFSK